MKIFKVVSSCLLLSTLAVSTSSCALFDTRQNLEVETFSESVVKSEILFYQALERAIYHFNNDNLTEAEIDKIDNLIEVGYNALDTLNVDEQQNKKKKSQANLVIVQTVIVELNMILNEVERKEG